MQLLHFKKSNRQWALIDKHIWGIKTAKHQTWRWQH